jgi:phosphoribosylformimino-5-aminoimidazole carboxamide ribotide isomerase
MRIIAAIDIIGGRCVRLTQGDFSRKKSYGTDPATLAKEMEENGIRYLHLVDLDGARAGTTENHRVLEEIASATGLVIDFSGGIRSEGDIRRAFSSGASRVTCGSIAVNNPVLLKEWLQIYGPGRIILGADFRDRKVATGAWLETSGREITEFLREYGSYGIKYALCTDISRDGMLEGVSPEIYGELTAIEGLSVIASGGIATLSDLRELQEAGCEGAVIGKALLEGRITYKELRELC